MLVRTGEGAVVGGRTSALPRRSELATPGQRLPGPDSSAWARPEGTRWTYHGPSHPKAWGVVIERYDHDPRILDDVIFAFPDDTMIAAYDFQLHAEDCPGPTFVGGVATKQPCPCGAWPGDPQHKVRRKVEVKHAMMGKMQQTSGELTGVVRPDGVIEVQSGPERPHIPMSYEDGAA